MTLASRLSYGVYAGLLICGVGAIAWVSGEPFVFPSLGPTAFVLATQFDDRPLAQTIVGSHTIGVVAGILAWLIFAQGMTISTVGTAGSIASGGFVVGAVVSVIVTTIGMETISMVHPPACATTLIVSLGLLTAPSELAIVVVSVVVLVGTDRLLRQAVRKAGLRW
ncbi:HPP family protein [Halocatena halophila]|uniref:HPP family protein n=1 Tax=Halocatena halophila TaxID=2814576 RepID=UPI002ED2BC75